MHDCGLLCLPCEHFMRQCLLAVRDPMHCMLRAHLPLGWPGPWGGLALAAVGWHGPVSVGLGGCCPSCCISRGAVFSCVV
jgi:hypothetical protein